MQCRISAKLFQSLIYWAVFLGLCFTSGWFASGVVENYVSRSTSFSQHEEIAVKRPVITIKLHHGKKCAEKFQVYHENIYIQYCPTYKTWEITQNCKLLQLGVNVLPIGHINANETVYLDRFEYFNIFR